MPNPVFTLSTNVLTWPKGYAFPGSQPREVTQAVDRTAAGGLQVETLGAVIHRIVLAFNNLDQAAHDAALNWYLNIAAGAGNAFTYTDMEANDYTVRWTNAWNFTEDKAGFSGSIELEVVD